MLACSRQRDPKPVFDHATQTFRHGDLGAALKEAEKGYKDFHQLSAEWAWKFRILQASALIWQGTSDRALALLESEPTPPPSRDFSIQKERLESSAYMALSRFPEAEAKLGEAERLCSASISQACASVVFARGGLEMRHGRFQQAQALFERTLSYARANGDRFLEANVLSSLAQSALQQEHFDEAVDWGNASYAIATELDAQDIAQDALGNLGWAHYRLGEAEKAEVLFVNARTRAEKLDDTVDQLRWITTLGYVYLDAGNPSAAEQAYSQALDLAKGIKSKQDVIDALMSLALVSERTGKLEQAREYADKAIALVPEDGDRLNILYPMLVKGHVAARKHDTQQAEKIYRDIEQDQRSHVFLKWEAEHALASLYEDENRPDDADREYRAALSTFETARSSLKHEESVLPFPANASGIYDDYIHFLVSKGKMAEALRVAEYQRGRTLAEGLGVLQKTATFKPDALNAQAIARKFGGTILFYSLGMKESYLWAITPQKTALFTLPAKSEIEPKVQRYRQALADQQEFLPTASDDGIALYRALVAPASALLPRNAKVFIIPDGSLNTLNFETLLVPDATPRYWIEDATITDASSLRLLAASRASQRRGSSLLLLGNAVAPNTDYPQLRKAAAEMDAIARHFPEAGEHILAADQATPKAYLSAKPEQYSYIHFVAHGTASQMSPLDSAIVLSRSDARDDSFKLYARDIIHHPLRAELVTISTCYGAGSRAYSGEGLVGLSWAFLRAGAHNVIGALWEVSDVSTPQLMDELYSSLQKGQSADVALRSAKLSLLHSKDFRKPFYWAPFQIYTGSQVPD